MTKKPGPKAERDHLVAGIADLKQKIAEEEVRSAKRLAHLRACLVGSEEQLAAVEQEVVAEDLTAMIEELFKVATDLDSGHTPERLSRFEFLCAMLHSSGRLAPSHQARQMCIGRMRRLPGSMPGRPPYRNWVAMAKIWVRPAPASVAA